MENRLLISGEQNELEQILQNNWYLHPVIACRHACPWHYRLYWLQKCSYRIAGDFRSSNKNPVLIICPQKWTHDI
jgi:hypothetical protein